jgi:beta-lactamase superfamily II metal-dependent hydrolase
MAAMKVQVSLDRFEGKKNETAVLVTEYGDFSVLLTGDSEKKERAWWRENADKGLYSQVTVLKLAHHGSRNGTDAAWLKAARPELAVACCGKNNSYGHPHQKTLKLLNAAKVRLLRTDEDGTITVTSDGEKWEVKTEKDREENGCSLPLLFKETVVTGLRPARPPIAAGAPAPRKKAG